MAEDESWFDGGAKRIMGGESGDAGTDRTLPIEGSASFDDRRPELNDKVNDGRG